MNIIRLLLKNEGNNQYGLLKMLVINRRGTFVGELTLFGNGFGNYGQGIKVQMRYSPMDSQQ